MFPEPQYVSRPSVRAILKEWYDHKSSGLRQSNEKSETIILAVRETRNTGLKGGVYRFAFKDRTIYRQEEAKKKQCLLQQGLLEDKTAIDRNSSNTRLETETIGVNADYL